MGIGPQHMAPEYRQAYEAGQQAERGHYEPVPPGPHYVYVQEPSEKGGRSQSIEGLTIPIVLASAVLFACVSGAFWTATQFASIKNSIENLYEKIEITMNPIVDRVRRIELDLERRTASRWTKADHLLWCERTARINPGWQCGNHIVNGGIMGNDLDPPPIWNGAKETAETWDTRSEKK